MKRAISKHLSEFIAVIVLVAIAGGVGVYILANERLHFPVFQAAPFKLKAELATAQAVTPGQGQTVRIAGVRIGDIGQVDLKDGKAIVTLDIDDKYKGLIHQDATALLRPKTGLKDMFLDVDPGTNAAPAAKKGWTIPVQNTLPDINNDEVFAALDADTRDYLKLLINDGGRGLEGRGADLRDLLRRFEPTHRDLARVAAAVATRRHNLRRLVHSLNVLNDTLAKKRTELVQLVDSSATVFRAFASENHNISRAVHDLPSALKATTGALRNVDSFATILAPTADKLRPAVRALDTANHALIPFEREAAPILRDKIRPFVRNARPVVHDLRPAAKDLAKGTPNLTKSFVVLNHLFNMLGFNPNGREGPTLSKARQEGYLFFVAWVAHQGLNLFSNADAHGSLRPVFLGGTCAILDKLTHDDPLAGLGLNLDAITGNPTLCPK